MNRHPIDRLSLTFGLLFLTALAGWMAVEIDLLTRSDLGLAVPVALIVAGTIGVLVSLRR